jgi:hypothetical protein
MQVFKHGCRDTSYLSMGVGIPVMSGYQGYQGYQWVFVVNQAVYLKGGGLRQELFVPKKYASIDKKDLEFIKNNIDWDIEKCVNYEFSGAPMSI